MSEATGASAADTRQYGLVVAAHGLITDYADVLTRGYLKDHPGEVMYRLNLLQEAIAVVRARAVREIAGNAWAATEPFDPAAEHDALVGQFAEHSCCCDWCLSPGGDAP